MNQSTFVIQTKELSKQFEDNLAVNRVNLDILSGEVYGLIGPNGAGKTTLLQMLASFAQPTIGEIYICGEKLLKDRPNSLLQRQIGFLPDDFPLYEDLSVFQYLDYFGQLYYLNQPHLKTRINEVLELVGLENKRHSLISTLSRGMKQRLGLARSVLHHPTVLFLDEPVSGLDPQARVQYREIIKLLQREGMTVLISSHILSDLEDFCTSIGIMELGKLVESSRLQELYRQDQIDAKKIVISVLNDLESLHEALAGNPSVTDCQISSSDNKIAITFNGGDLELAYLLQSLIEKGYLIREFASVQTTLEDIFLKRGYDQTS